MRSLHHDIIHVITNTIILCSFTIALCTAAQRRPNDVLVATAVITGVDASIDVTNVDLQFFNKGREVVTAWSYSLEGKYPDGSTQTRAALVDEIAALLAPDPGQRFRPGDSRKARGALPINPQGESPVIVTVRISMVALEDGIALGDRTECRRLSFLRTQQADLLQNELNWIENSRKLAKSPHELKYLINEPTAERGSAKKPGAITRQLLPLLDTLGGPEKIDSVLRIFTDLKLLLATHSKLTEDK